MYKYSALQLRDALNRGDLTALEITEAFLKRIRKLDVKVQAFLNVLPERALKKASEIDQKRAQGKPLGKLAGIPIALKDNIHIRDEITTCASKFLTNFVAPFDATVTRLIDQEDGIILGKTNLDEFAMGSSTETSAFNLTNNPWKLDCVPGGSSGGSAAAVAARFSALSLGSDTGGSIRQPAAFTGTVGYKPTYGRVSRYGLVAFASSLDQIGPFANCTEDVALMMEAIGHHCNHDSTSIPAPGEPFLDELGTSIQGKRLGVPWKFLENLPHELAANFKESIKIFQSLGVEIVEVEFDLLKYLLPVYYIVSTAEASTNLARFDGIRYGARSKKASSLEQVYDLSKHEGYGPEVKKRILLGTFVLASGYQDAYYKKAQKVRTLLIKRFEEIFGQCDLLAMPSTPSPAFKQGEIVDPLIMYMQDVYTVAANLAGLPGISVPSGFTKDQKPIGIQLMGPQLEDARVMRFAHHFEKESGISQKIPPLFDCEV